MSRSLSYRFGQMVGYLFFGGFAKGHNLALDFWIKQKEKIEKCKGGK